MQKLNRERKKKKKKENKKINKVVYQRERERWKYQVEEVPNNQ